MYSYRGYDATELIARMGRGEKLYCKKCRKHTKHTLEGGHILYTGCAKCGKEFEGAPAGIEPFKVPNHNAISVMLAIAIMVVVVVAAFEITLGSFAIKDISILRTIWAICGIAGYFLMKWKRAEFYKNKSPLFWIWLIIAYFCLGPAILGCGLVCWLCPPLK